MKISLSMELMFSLDTIEDAARQFLRYIGKRNVVAFQGEMGAGKTTFIHAVCKALGVQNSLSSPTFSIINEYLLPDGIMYHIDLYRLKDEAEAVAAGVEDCIISGRLCFVEWPERAAGIFPEGTAVCHFYRIADNKRKLQINL